MADESFIFNPCEPGVPLALWGALMQAMGEAAKEEGFDLYFKQETGFERVWIRPTSKED